jgi:UDP-2-acetamido-2,6-beta-L-arabino-hexul-4-ose reductase
LKEYSKETNNNIVIYRLSNIFGKWCRPNYNSVVATFCHNIANNLPIMINNPENELRLIYIEDIIEDIIKCLEEDEDGYSGNRYIKPTYTVTVGKLASIINSFKESRDSMIIPDFSNPLIKKLYSTYLSYLPENEFSYELRTNKDDRGNLTELLKSPQFGQIFMSTTKPGVIRGNHYHHTKVEKFCIIKGKGRINFRKINCDNIISYEASDDRIEIIDIPPCYTHNIENIGSDEMIVLFWANEIFSKESPDTYSMKV